MSTRIRWLGAAGIEIEIDDKIIAIDPYFTRIPFWQLFLGYITPDAGLVKTYLPRCDYILVTHSHYDHLLDVPEIQKVSGAQVYGSQNTCRLVDVCNGLPEKRKIIQPGDRLELGPYQIQVYSARPHSMPGFTPGPLPVKLHSKLRAIDYRSDTFLCFRIQVDNLSLFHGIPQDYSRVPTTDILMVGSFLGSEHDEIAYYKNILGQLKSRIIIPIHWDDFFRPLNKPERPFLVPTYRFFPPLTRWDSARFERLVYQVDPSVKVLLLNRMEHYDLDQLVKETLS